MIEIDGVRRALEGPMTEAGDYISDEYLKVIDLSTTPRHGTNVAIRGLSGAIQRLNFNVAATAVYLRTRDMAEVYDNVASQINEINQDVEGLEQLRLLATVPDRVNYSGLYAWDSRSVPEYV